MNTPTTLWPDLDEAIRRRVEADLMSDPALLNGAVDDLEERAAIQDEGCYGTQADEGAGRDLGQEGDTPEASEQEDVPGVVILPSDHCTFPRSAGTVFPLLAETKRYFTRDGTPVELVEADTGSQLRIVTADSFRSTLDRHSSRVMAHISIGNGKLALRNKRCSKDSALALLATQEAREILPPIRLVTRSCVIVPGDNGPLVLGPGYHPEAGGILVTAKQNPDDISLVNAVAAINGVLVDFLFQTSSDKSRAIADIITPAFVMGGWFRDWAPIQTAEADKSQSGKTYRQKVTRAIYSERAYKVSKRDGGVGSHDESLAQALLSGWPFIAFDNQRGRLD